MTENGQNIRSIVRASITLAAAAAVYEALARSVLLSDDEVDRLRDAVYKELVAFMQEERTTIPRAVDLMFIAHNLERIADHATNIAEDVLFLMKGIDVRHHAEVREQQAALTKP